MMPLTNKSTDWSPIYHKTNRMLPQIFNPPLFYEQGDSKRAKK